ncbi:lipid II flippase MurJ [uncultured Serinicoccus sp.]|uniref:lipid II flippase MurJ n=1 Tax=uncultured Serinicoccus sp. TaxID=735514 RepID=UPI00261BD775|nr:lipid II flippase MurJ [uncultured Serinicoccus sp.]
MSSSGPGARPGTGPGPGPGPSRRIVGQGLLAAAGVVAATTLLARVAGVARWVVFSEAVGTTCLGQVYTTVNLIPNVVFEIAAGGALAAVAVPLVARHLQDGDEDRADRTASALLGWALLVLVPLGLLAALLAGPITSALLGAGDPDGCDPAAAQQVGRLMLLLFAPQVVLYGIGIVLTGVLQAHRRFLAAALAPLLSSLVVIAVYLLVGATVDADVPLGEVPDRALLLLAGGTTVGVAALSLPLLLPVARAGVRWRPTLRFPAGSGRLAGGLALAGLVTVGTQQVFTVVVILVANSTGVGGITVWTYAQTVYLLPYAVLVVPLATAAFPRLVGDAARTRAVLRRTATAVVAASVAGAAALAAASGEVGAAFLALDAGAGGAGREALGALPAALAVLAPGLVGFGLVALLTRALYVADRPRAAAAGAASGWLLAALVGLVGAGAAAADGVAGVLVLLAGASSVGMVVSAGVLAWWTRVAWGPGALTGLPRALAVSLAGALVGVLVAAQLPGASDPSGEPATLAVAVALGLLRGGVAAAVVLGLVLLLDREAAAPLRERLRMRGRRRESDR